MLYFACHIQQLSTIAKVTHHLTLKNFTIVLVVNIVKSSYISQVLRQIDLEIWIRAENNVELRISPKFVPFESLRLFCGQRKRRTTQGRCPIFVGLPPQNRSWRDTNVTTRLQHSHQRPNTPLNCHKFNVSSMEVFNIVLVHSPCVSMKKAGKLNPSLWIFERDLELFEFLLILKVHEYVM